MLKYKEYYYAKNIKNITMLKYKEYYYAKI